MKVGDELRAPMGPFTAKMEVVSFDDKTLVSEARLIELYPTKHKPVNDGFGQCVHCGRPVHFVPINWLVPLKENDTRSAGWYRHNPLPKLRVIPDRERTHCSKCGKPGEWYTFKPGSGECTECQS